MRRAWLIVTFCAGCAILPQAREEAALRPAALLDAYLIAHGMAQSYAESPDAVPAVVVQLAHLDMQAAEAVRTRNDGATAQAVAALTDFAARQSALSAP